MGGAAMLEMEHYDPVFTALPPATVVKTLEPPGFRTTPSSKRGLQGGQGETRYGSRQGPHPFIDRLAARFA